MSKVASLPASQRFFSANRPDLRSREALAKWLAGHYRYNTLHSVNRSTAYANCVKMYRLGLTAEQENKACEMLDVPGALDFANAHISAFTRAQGGRYTAGFNGRSDGYLVMYSSRYRQSEHKSVCTECGQRNFRAVYREEGLASPELGIAKLVCEKRMLTVDAILQEPGFLALGVEPQVAVPFIRKWLSKAKDGGFDNTCGRCHSPARVPFSSEELQVFPGHGIDQDTDEFFDPDTWPLSALQERAKLVMAFDEMCDLIRAALIERVGLFRVVERVVHVPTTVKVLEPV